MNRSNRTAAVSPRLPMMIAAASVMFVGGLLWALAAAADVSAASVAPAPVLAAVPADLAPLVALHRDFGASPVPLALRP
jgi:hypothetical protein